MQDRPERQRLLPLPPHGRDSKRIHAGVWRKHAQRHIHEPWRQVLLRRLPILQSGSVTCTTTAAAPTVRPCFLSFIQGYSAEHAGLFSALCCFAFIQSHRFTPWDLLSTTTVFCCWILSSSTGATEGQVLHSAYTSGKPQPPFIHKTLQNVLFCRSVVVFLVHAFSSYVYNLRLEFIDMSFLDRGGEDECCIESTCFCFSYYLFMCILILFTASRAANPHRLDLRKLKNWTKIIQF